MIYIPPNEIIKHDTYEIDGDTFEYFKTQTGIESMISYRQEWFKNGLHHRIDGPAILYNSGAYSWYKDGKRHRDNGPALKHLDIEAWYKNGKLHREDGPAKQCFSYSYDKPYIIEFWLDNKIYSEEEYYRVIKLLFLI